MLNIAKTYATNRIEEEEGKWFDTFGGEVQLKMRRFSSKKSIAIRTELEAPLKKKYKNTPVPMEENEKLALDHFCEGVLLDWKGMKENGIDVPFSISKAKEIMNTYPDFFREALLECIDIASFRDEKKKDVMGK